MAIVVTLAVALSAMVANGARADPGAEAFVTKNANDVLRVLNDKSLPLDEKKRRFRSMVDQIADVPRITRFVLGRYARDVDPKTLSDFSDVFRRYATSVYETRLGDYAGETLKVTGSTDRQPGDTVVHSEVTGGNQQDAVPVNWRVLTDSSGQHKVVDVEVLGVWLAINQRDEVVSIIQNNGGRVAAATEAIRGKLQQMDIAG
jgi:phospholipid transport system substrate-binding protein